MPGPQQTEKTNIPPVLCPQLGFGAFRIEGGRNNNKGIMLYILQKPSGRNNRHQVRVGNQKSQAEGGHAGTVSIPPVPRVSAPASLISQQKDKRKGAKRLETASKYKRHHRLHQDKQSPA